MDIFDTHTHYNDKMYDYDIEEIIKKIRKENVKHFVVIGATIKESIEACRLAKKYNEYFSVGVHPDVLPDFLPSSNYANEIYKNIEQLIKERECIAIGEVGLDYYGENKDENNRNIQKEWFIKFINIKKQYNLPLIIHSRDAYNDTYDILEKFNGRDNNTIIHCYSYDKELAKKFLNLNYYFGIGGVITFKNAKKLKEAMSIIPLENIVTETDCPYLSPEPFRGKRNDSSNIKYIIEAISQIKEVDKEEVAKILYNNALRVYNIK
ncbi:MAG: TatD family hydrolase [Eubacteriales bacterium]|nr:TatD family hydrolase [Eubacteriales bacterium]